jgi:hypothetical protein
MKRLSRRFNQGYGKNWESRLVRNQFNFSAPNSRHEQQGARPGHFLRHRCELSSWLDRQVPEVTELMCVVLVVVGVVWGVKVAYEPQDPARHGIERNA